MVIMNYIYELIRDKQFGIMIMESIDDTKNDESDDQDLDLKSVSSVNEILFALNRKEFKNSQLERMYIWLLANHPELLL